MNLSRSQKLLFLSLLFGFYILAWTMQYQFLLKGDVIWQMHMARLILAGGNYLKDFFEINPPLAIYLYMPAVLLQKTFALLTIDALRIYIFLLSTFSLIICYFLTNKIFSPDDYILGLIFLFTLFIVYLILPLNEFGQRECLLLYFTMPYFLLVSLRLMNKSVQNRHAIGIGILAGVGFSIKPFFLLAFILVELYFILNQTKPWKAWLRPETACIFSFIAFYLIFIYLNHPEYITIIVPLASRFYYKFFSHPWQVVILNPLAIYIIISPLFYLIPLFSSNPYKKLCTVLMLALVGFFLAYGIQQIPWYYHILPPFGIALLLYSLLFGLFLAQINNSRNNLLIAWLLGSLIFIYPFLFLSQYYEDGVLQARYLKSLIDDLHTKERGRPIYFFSSKTAYMVSVLEHAGVLHASRLQFLSWLSRYFHFASPQNLTPQQQIDEKYFVTMLAEDIKKNKPDLIYVDISYYYVFFQPKTKIQIDYVKILSQYHDFKQAWQAYHYLKTIEVKNQYKFDVYSRLNPTTH